MTIIHLRFHNAEELFTIRISLKCDFCFFKVTLEEINSQIALEYGQAMTVRVLKADGEVMRKC